MHHLAAQSNLLLARLQRTRPFAAGAPVLFDLAPLLREAAQWLHAVEQTLPLIPDPDLLPVLDNYDLLHRIVRHTPGTPLLRQAYHRILSNAAHLPLDQINAYVVDAYYKNLEIPPVKLKQVRIETCFSLSAANLELTHTSDHTGSKDFTGGKDLQILASNFQLKIPKILKSWSSHLQTTNPSLLTPEQISRLRLLLLQHPITGSKDFTGGEDLQILAQKHQPTTGSKDLKILASSLLTQTIQNRTEANSDTLHALLTLTVSQTSHLSPKSANYASCIKNYELLQRALAQAPDNHPLDRAARRQLLANHKALSPKPTPRVAKPITNY